MVTADAGSPIVFLLSPGNKHDASEGKNLLLELGEIEETSILMDRAYDGDKTRAFIAELGYTPVVPPKSNRLNPWEYDKEHYKIRNVIE